jgi:hypothetical protein
LAQLHQSVVVVVAELQLPHEMVVLVVVLGTLLRLHHLELAQQIKALLVAMDFLQQVAVVVVVQAQSELLPL